MAEGDYYALGNRQRIPRDPFREQPLASRFMEDDFGLPSFANELSMEWPGWARSRLGHRIDAPWTGSLRTGFPRTSMGSPQGFSTVYTEAPRRTTAPPGNSDEPWKVCVNVHSFKPEELNVKTKDGFVEVSVSQRVYNGLGKQGLRCDLHISTKTNVISHLLKSLKDLSEADLKWRALHS
ncbi:hypothetical protein DNTS_007033 [Danionella cerebrum]|uniref:SHSP domain-containing protein n=2 Tax=Danionella cerebrum TaxID=2873325 RepID=A0A553RQ67_9TELE|nr:hypothetical protein DNTS_007033 [Danionella translucida]